MTKPAERFDVIVVGGGPAGACTAGLLAMQNRKVLLLEKEKFPRYHIGESLITAVWPTLERLGLRERLEALGFDKKYGAKVLWGNDGEAWGFRFEEAGPFKYTYQVRRAEFDALLLSRARELGATVIEEANVTSAILDGERVKGVRYTLGREGPEFTAHASITVDASGQTRLIGRQFSIADVQEDLKNVAVWSYYQGCKRYDGDAAGHTLIENLQDGWLWFIPLGQDVTSVGFVTPGSIVKKSGKALDAVLEARLAESNEVKKMMEGSTRVGGYRTERDWSYTCKRFHGPGWALVGDASAFIDPLLSTGVALAVRGARILTDALRVALDDPRREAAALAAYEKNQRAFLDVILEFVRYFYDATRSRAEYHTGAQDLIDPSHDQEPSFDFVQLVSGLALDDRLDIPEAAPMAKQPVMTEPSP